METSKRIAGKPGKTQLTLWGGAYFMDSFGCHLCSTADGAWERGAHKRSTQLKRAAVGSRGH